MNLWSFTSPLASIAAGGGKAGDVRESMDEHTPAVGELADDPMRLMCSNCEARITHTHTKWANKYGESRRFFCWTCGMFEDRRVLWGKSFQAVTVKPPRE